MTYTPEQISQIVLKVLKEIETPNVLSLSFEEKLKLARHPNTTGETLSVLSTDENPAVRYFVAKHPNTTGETLSVLATDKDFYVRQLVAGHPNYYKSLSFEEKLKLAQHPNTTPETLSVLATGWDPDIRYWVARHPNYKPKTLELTPEQYDALKQLIESGQNESLKGLLDT